AHPARTPPEPDARMRQVVVSVRLLVGMDRMSPDAKAFPRSAVGPNRIRFGVPVESQISLPFHGEPAAEVVVIEIAPVFCLVGTFETEADGVATRPATETLEVP